MADHDFFVNDIGKWQSAEELREGLVDSIVFVLGLDLSFESIDVVDLFGLMVSSGHMHEVNVDALPSNQGYDALD